MQYKRFGNTCMVRIDLGEDIVESLKKLCEDEQIRLGRVEAIGATDHAVIGVYDLAKKEYYPYIHLHTVLADQQHVIHGGHVLEMRVGATCEMFVTVLEGEVTRQKEEAIGINLWTF